MQQLSAQYLGFDISTTAVTALVTDGEGNYATASVPMYGACKLHGQPAHDLNYTPLMMHACLLQLQLEGWGFVGQAGVMGLSVRQHDLAVLNPYADALLEPALSWQFDPTITYCAELINEQLADAEYGIGNVEPRFILPKLYWLFDYCPGLRAKLKDRSLMTTGDWIITSLTGNYQLSCSDGRSNGLVCHATGERADGALWRLGIRPEWFPDAVPAGCDCGQVDVTCAPAAWKIVAETLQGWIVVSSLGDNHAGAVGCGLNETAASENTVIASFGTSGTVVRQVPNGTDTKGKCAQFDFFGRTLLLSMVPSCGAAFNRVQSLTNMTPAVLGDEAWKYAAVPGGLLSLPRIALSDSPSRPEIYPTVWDNPSGGYKAAAVLLAIVDAMVQRTRDVIREASTPITTVVLTGGLSKSQLVFEAYRVALGAAGCDVQLKVSERSVAPDQAAAWGAMMTAWRLNSSLRDVIEVCCPQKIMVGGGTNDTQLKHYFA